MSTDNKNSTLAAFYVTGGLRQLIPMYPLYAIMFTEHGISSLELSILFVIWAAVGLFTEVPSGAWADTYSRKWMVVASALFKSLGFFIWYLWQDFPGYALGFIAWGFGSSIRSGAFEALLHDLLTEWNESLRFTFHFGRIRAVATLSVVAGELLGGLLIVNGYDFVLIVSMIIPIVATLPFIVFVSDVEKRESIADQRYLQHLKAGMREAFVNKAILFIILSTAFLLTAHGVFDEFVPPVLSERGFSLAVVAYLAAPIYLAQSSGEFFANRFSGISLGQLLRLMIVGTCFLFSIYWLPAWANPLAIGLFFFIFGLASTLLAGLLQQKIEGTSRATVTSIASLGDNVGAIVWFLVFGSIAEVSSMTAASSVFAVLIIISCLVAGLLRVRWHL